MQLFHFFENCFLFTACDGFYYGENCANKCDCGVGATRCDAVSGCLCMVGWTGVKCSIDVDECGATTNPCASQNNTVCINNPGSYVCSCKNGYQKENDACVSK